MLDDVIGRGVIEDWGINQLCERAGNGVKGGDGRSKTIMIEFNHYARVVGRVFGRRGGRKRTNGWEVCLFGRWRVVLMARNPLVAAG